VIVIPAIDLRQGKCVRLRQGDFNRETVYNDDPMQVARHYRDSGFENLHVVDLDGARSGEQQHRRLSQKSSLQPAWSCNWAAASATAVRLSTGCRLAFPAVSSAV
jgi:uncharacterized protein related to proFAR isomerase